MKTARNADEVNVKWAKSYKGTSMWANMGAPIIVGDNIYVAVKDKIKKIDKNTGEELAEGTMASSVGFFSFACYGDGMLFVPAGGRVQAFDADTLESLWMTEASGYQTNAPVIYNDGRIYMGLTNGSASEGEFFCVDTKDDDPAKTDEIKPYLWEDKASACYWAGAAVVGNAVIYGNDAGELQSRDKVTGEAIDILYVDSNIRSSVAYDETTGDIYFTAKDAARAYGMKLNDDGSFDKTTLRAGDVQGLTTTTPVVYNGRVYVTSGSMDDPSVNAITVLNADTMEKIYEASLGGICQASPLMSTAYANAGNKNTVYLYVTLNNSTSEVKVIRDYEGNTTPDVQSLYVPEPEFQQYCTHSLICDDEGTIFHRNDGGNLIALSATPSEALTAVDKVTDQIAALGEITDLSQKDAVVAARAAYDALSAEQQAMVLNADVLTAAEAKIAALEEAAKQEQPEQKPSENPEQKPAADNADKGAQTQNKAKTAGVNVGTGIFASQNVLGAAAVFAALAVLGGAAFVRYRRQK